MSGPVPSGSLRRARVPTLCAVALAFSFGAPAVQGQDVSPRPHDAFRAGAYDEAVTGFTRALRSDPADVEVRAGLMRALTVQGDYERAVELGHEAPEPTAVANQLGEALFRLGRYAEALEAFETAAASSGPWALTAEANAAETLFRTGRLEEAFQRFDRFIDIYNARSGRMSAADLVAVGRAVHHLGRARPGLFQDALRAFDEASAADPGWAEPRVLAGDLFLEKYSSPEAKEEYGAVLERNPHHPGALLGMARALEFDGVAGAETYLERLLEVNPRHAEARALMARRHLTAEDRERAREEVDQALEVNPTSLAALSALAAIHFVEGDQVSFREVRGRALAINPRYAELDATVADVAIQIRRYEDAVERARAAVALDSAAWEAWGIRGINELRTGAIDEGRRSLERAFGGDPFNPWFKNTLDLLDTFERFRVHETPHFELFLHGDESELLATYLEPIAEEAYAKLRERYGTEPRLPVRAELYPSHADFSVRALGEAGLGALGVSFGSVLVMDSPGARTLGQYNWASVFWHELAHTFHLAMTDHRVPRWFSEGLAVHEQRQARPGWGHQPSLGFLAALRDDRLKKVSELDDGFMRPDYPEQVIHSYYQGSLVFELIENRWGFSAIREMLEGYREGATTDALFESVLGMEIGAFDEIFDTHLHDRFAREIRGLPLPGAQPAPGASVDELEASILTRPNDFTTRLVLGARLLEEGRADDAVRHLEAAQEIFPGYTGPDAPAVLLARIHRERGENARAAEILAGYDARDEASYATRMERAELLRDLGRPREAAEALAEAVLIWPYDLDLHRELAALYEEIEDYEGELVERRAIVALRPTDLADAHYRLARAEWRTGDSEAARRSVLRALEIAPNFDEALELLLELRGGAGEHR